LKRHRSPQAPAPKAPAATPTVWTTPGPPDPGAEPVDPFRKRGAGRRRGESLVGTEQGQEETSDEERDIHKAMVRSLEAMTSLQLRRDQKEDKKKSMLSRLSPKGGSLFKLLSAKDWKDRNPKLPAFTK
jgi:hypothetical protein